jgi:hypothetical protein
MRGHSSFAFLRGVGLRLQQINHVNGGRIMPAGEGGGRLDKCTATRHITLQVTVYWPWRCFAWRCGFQKSLRDNKSTIAAALYVGTGQVTSMKRCWAKRGALATGRGWRVGELGPSDPKCGFGEPRC